MPLDMQKTYDTVKDHLLTQKQRSTPADSDLCLYRGPNGLKCSIGCLIDDRQYTEEMENKEVSQLMVDRKQRVGVRFRESIGYGNGEKPTDTEIAFLQALQDLHDDVPVREWRKALQTVAKDYELKP
jgi:hypothetical protein